MSHHPLQSSEVADHWPKPKAPVRWFAAAVAQLKRGRQACSLPTATSVYLAFLALLVFPTVLKTIKAIHVTDGRAGVLDLVRVLAADVALACFSLGVGLLLLHGLRRARWGRILFAAATALYLLVLLMLSAIEHQAWVRSASLLDWKIFWYTIEHFRDLQVVIAAETTTAGVLLLVGAGVLSLLPILGDTAAALLLGYEARYRPRHGVYWMLSALPLLWLASSAPRAPELFPLTHSASVGLLSGALDAAEQTQVTDIAFTPPDAERIRTEIERTLTEAGLTQNGQGKPKNVLLMVLESTRFDATSVYVPHLNTTPKLRELAQRGLQVDRAYVDMPHTSKALVSILCGYSPRWSVQINEAEPGGLPDPCLAHVFGHLGYRRGFFQAATGTYENRHQLALNAGYEDVFTRESYDEAGFEETNYLSVEDKVMLEPALRWVQESKHSPFFLTLLTCITHHSYGLPSDFKKRHFPRRAARIGGRLPRPFSDYNRYLNTLRYTDELLDELLAGLERLGVLEDTLVVVVGDHGQAFHEHGQKAHNTVIWDEGLRVPLVMYNERAIPEPRLVEGPRRQVDIAPTVLDLVGVSYEGKLFDGRHLLREPPHEEIYSSCWYDDRCSAETTANVRVVDHYDNQPMEVYDLEADPFERRNLLQQGKPEQKAQWKAVANAARERIRAHREQVGARYERSIDAESPAFLLAEEPQPAYPVHARLDEYVELLGYDTPSHEVRPDGFWDVVIYFKCLKPSPEGWRFFGELQTVDGRRYQVDHHPANGRFYLHQCKPGTVVADHVRVWIPGDFPPGKTGYFWGSVYLKELGHVRRTNRRLGRRSVIPLERGLLADDQALRLATLDVKPQYRTDLAELRDRSILRTPPPIESPLDVRFGEDLVLLEASVEPVQAKRLGSVFVRTVWRVDGEVKGPWKLLAHMDSHREGYWLRRAHTPVDGVHPIDNWKPGTYVIDTYNMPVPEQMPRGEAKIWVGVRTDRRRMRVLDPGNAETDDHRALAGTIFVR